MQMKVSNQQIRQLWLQSNYLEDTNDLKLNLLQIIRNLGFVQIDTIQNVTRAHHHILWSRNNKYQEYMFDEILKNGDIFEHFTHDASVLPIESYPYWNIQYIRIKEKIDKSKYYKNILDNQGIENILNRLEKEGPLHIKDFSSDSVHKTTLDYMWYSGILGTSHRINFKKYYDKKENIIPFDILNKEICEKEQINWLCNNALKRLGIANAKEIKNFWNVLSLKEVNDWIKNNKDILVEVLWENNDGKYTKSFSFSNLENRLKELKYRNKKIKIINPFDPAVRDRIRLKNIFGFDYKIEIFVSNEKRISGYYVYPLLFEDKFIGRIELKADRKIKEFAVLNFWKEDSVIWDDEKQKLLDIELNNFALFIGIEKVNWICNKSNK
jgi:uncharacterized protein YcaQ